MIDTTPAPVAVVAYIRRLGGEIDERRVDHCEQWSCDEALHLSAAR